MENSNLRILFASHTYVIGINQGKLNAISKNCSVDVALLAPKQWKARGWGTTFALEKSYPSIKYYPASVMGGGRGGGYIYSLNDVSYAIETFKPHLLQVEQEVFSLSAFQMALYAKSKNLPLVIFGWENMNRRLSFVRRQMCQFVLNTASLIITGNHDGKHIMREWGYKGPIEVIPQMGVDTHLFSPLLRQNHSVHEFCIGYMGRLIHHKGIDILFSAVRQLKQQGDRFKVVLCGSGKDEAQLRQCAKQEEIADLVIWVGRVPHADVAQEIAKFDILVLPSRTVDDWKEQFGHILIEAMSMGVPVIGSTCGEIPNVIGRDDLIFPEENSEALAAIIKRMIQKPDWHSEISHYGIERVNQRYSHECIAEALVQQWLTILKPKP
jgi:glycosyltransferase involved in cell wall biosynthesis